MFEGWVRLSNEGKTVTGLEYEAYEALSLKEGRTITDEAKDKFAILDAACIHRTGLLTVGGLAVWVGVTAEHRGPAFAACSFIIDQIKHRLPIWKKETYSDGSHAWVNCQSNHTGNAKQCLEHDTLGVNWSAHEQTDR